MDRVFGRVLVKETNTGVAGLVVAAFDLDLPRREGADRVHREAGEGPAGVEMGKRPLDQLGNRLGSVLTDERGEFEFTFDRAAIQPEGREQRPDLVLVVFAPEDSISVQNPSAPPPEERILHVSRFARADAGPVEAYVIRLLQDQLKRFQIPTTAPVAATSADPHRDTARHLASVEHAWALRDAVKERLALRRKQELERSRQAAETAKQKFKTLSSIPTSLRTSDRFVPRGQPVAEAQKGAIEAGVERLKLSSTPLRLHLSDAELARLKLKPDGTPASADEKPEAEAVFDILTGRTGGTDLVRARSLIDACVPPEAHLNDSLAHHGRDGDDLNDPGTGSNGSGPNGDVPAGLTRQQAKKHVLDRVVGQVQDLRAATVDGLRHRLDAEHAAAEVETSVKQLTLTGGPADVTAYHDFHVLQLAFQHVWTEAFDENLREAAEQLYQEAVRFHEETGVDVPPADAINDVQELTRLISDLGSATTTEQCPPADVTAVFPSAPRLWDSLSEGQQVALNTLARTFIDSGRTDRNAEQAGQAILEQPAGRAGRIGKLVLQLGQHLAEPYSFQVFAPDSYNFGVMLTYRQQWEPQAYQVGDLVATIPLAPGESHKYTTKQVVRKSRAEKEIQRALSSRSDEASQTLRGEAEIMRKVSTATNFRMTASGSFNLGLASMNSSTEFGLSQAEDSSSHKKEFREATRKAAEEYKLERTLEVDSAVAQEREETTTGEISNPNNEITVTYLFYELQRVYQVSEQIHRVRPVILVAQDVPAPHEIDEAWLVAHEWILRRVLLDDSLRPALDYLSDTFAGDELYVGVKRAVWEKQKAIVDALEPAVADLIDQRDKLRAALLWATMTRDVAKGAPEGFFPASYFPDITEKWLTELGVSLEGLSDDVAKVAAWKAKRKAMETILQQTDEAMRTAQKKLADAATALEQSTREYTQTLERQMNRRTAIDQLRVHVKQNIIHYMQAIWDHEPPDQRFFRLYNKDVQLARPAKGWKLTPDAGGSGRALHNPWASGTPIHFTSFWGDTLEADVVKLSQIADLDNPLGYKGNYIIFPLTRPTYLTTYMLREFVDDYFGVYDPDEAGNYTIQELGDYVACVLKNSEDANEKAALKAWYIQRLSEPRRAQDQIIVPSGQLFIEALPGRHPLLEDFKLRHRLEDVRKAKAEVRHAELENLRLAARLIAGEREDPDVERRIVVDKGTVSAIDPDT